MRNILELIFGREKVEYNVVYSALHNVDLNRRVRLHELSKIMPKPRDNGKRFVTAKQAYLERDGTDIVVKISRQTQIIIKGYGTWAFKS